MRGVSKDDFREVAKKRSQNALQQRLPKKIPRTVSFPGVQEALGSSPLHPGEGCSSGRVPWGRASAAREDWHVAPAEGSAPGPAALIGQWLLPGPGMHLSMVQTKRAMSSQPRGQLPEPQVPLVGPTNANTIQRRQPTWAVARHECRLPPPHVGQLSPQRLWRFHLQLFGLRLLGSCHLHTLTLVWLCRASRPSARWLRPLGSSPPPFS